MHVAASENEHMPDSVRRIPPRPVNAQSYAVPLLLQPRGPSYR